MYTLQAPESTKVEIERMRTFALNYTFLCKLFTVCFLFESCRMPFKERQEKFYSFYSPRNYLKKPSNSYST